MRLSLLVLALGLSALIANLAAQGAPERSAAEVMDVLMWNREQVGGSFALVDHRG
jgi:protein SCO1/2